MVSRSPRQLMRMVLMSMVLVLCATSRGAGQQPEPTILDASGTWRASDAKDSGKWTARFQIAPAGALSGTIALLGMGNDSPAEIEGAVDGDQIKFGLVSTRAEASAGKPLDCAFEGIVRGVRVKGTFLDAQGREGRWEGWWSSGGRKVRDNDEPTGPIVILDQ